MQLHWQILIALGLGAFCGWLTGDETAVFGVTFYAVYDFIGSIFIQALKMLIVPLITSSIIVGVARIGSTGDLGRLGGKTLGFYVISGFLAILVGLVLVNIVQPGVSNGEPVKDALALTAEADDFAAKAEGGSAGDVAQIFLRMVPPNIVQAAADGQMLGLIFFSLLFGYFMTRVGHEHASPLHSFWDGVFNVMMRMTEWIMKFAPIGVFGLVARIAATVGDNLSQAVLPLFIFALVVVAALVIHAVIVLPMLVRFMGKVRPWGIFRAMSPAMLTAFSTASSSATLPVTMDCVEKNAGVSNRVSSFVLPLGATVNMNGTALYECVAVIFLAQAYGFELTMGTQFIIVFTALVTSIGVAGIPSASLVAIAIILTAVGMPVEAIGPLFLFDRVLDMARTSVNVFGDSCAAVVVARSQGEEDVLNGTPEGTRRPAAGPSPEAGHS